MHRNGLRVFASMVCLALASVASSSAQANDLELPGRVSSIADGDTVHFVPNDPAFQIHYPELKKAKVSKDARSLTVRLVTIDTPEAHFQGKAQQPWADAATMQLQKLIGSPQTPVTLRSRGLDKYGRVLGILEINQKDVNLYMVASGWAVPYVICSGPSCDNGFFERERIAQYFAACDSAIKAGRGIYNRDNPLKEMPFEFRRRIEHKKNEKFVGDLATRRLYSPLDYKKVDLCRRVFFMNAEEAMRIGFHE